MKYTTIAAGLAGVVLAVGGAAWFRHTLDEAFERGRRIAAAEVEIRIQKEAGERWQEAEAALARSNREIVTLERSREQLQEQYDDLVAKSAASGAGRPCLDPDVVRALAAIGAVPAKARENP